MENVDQKSNGALLGSVIIIILIIIGGIYLIRTKLNNIQEENVAQEEINAEANMLSSSDEFEDIEADLEANGNIDSLDKNLQ